MKYAKSIKEIQALSNEDLFSFARELGHRMTKTVYGKVSHHDNLANFLERINKFIENEKADADKVTVHYQSNNIILLNLEKDLDVNSLEDRRELESWYSSMLDWERRDREEFERLKAKHNW